MYPLLKAFRSFDFTTKYPWLILYGKQCTIFPQLLLQHPCCLPAVQLRYIHWVQLTKDLCCIGHRFEGYGCPSVCLISHLLGVINGLHELSLIQKKVNKIWNDSTHSVRHQVGCKKLKGNSLPIRLMQCLPYRWMMHNVLLHKNNNIEHLNNIRHKESMLQCTVKESFVFLKKDVQTVPVVLHDLNALRKC